MYQALLTRRYLTSKLMPLLAAVSVMLCTAMVLIVWSVMGGFLVLLLSAGKQMIGDASIAWPIRGISHYQQLIDDLEADPLIAHATPTIEALGLIQLPSGEPRTVQVIGVDPQGYDRVTGFFDRLWWKPLDTPLPKDKQRLDPRLTLPDTYDTLARTLIAPDPETGLERPAVILGIDVTRFNERTAEGFYNPRWYFMPNEVVTVSLVPMTDRGGVAGTADRRFAVANEFQTGMYQVDSSWIIAPLADVQEMVELDEQQLRDPTFRPGMIDPETGRPMTPAVIGTRPARATNILIKAADGALLDRPDGASGSTPTVIERIHDIYANFAAKHPGQVPDPERVLIFTWEEKPGIKEYVAAVRKEIALILFLFLIISLTAVVLIFSIFWAMVSEKTKDVGTLRAIGASRVGIAWLFLRYGLAIGVVGSVAGVIVAHLIVWNINPIHDAIIAAGRALQQNWAIWDPTVYTFARIPNDVEPTKAAIVLSVGVFCSVVGALIPSVRAARMDPVRALRFE